MGLHQYEIDFSPLAPDEKELLAKHVDGYTFNGLFWKADFQSAVFFLDENLDINLLNVPKCCHLNRIP